MTSPRQRWTVIAASAATFVVLASPAGRAMLEGSLFKHMMIQLPLLALVGMGIGFVSAVATPSQPSHWNQFGTTGLLFVLVVATFWMLPRSMDAALVDPRWEVAKFASLPLAGIVLARSYPQSSVLVRGLLHGHVVSALGVMGWAYLVAPVRLCNSYLASDQQSVGTGLLAIGAALAVYFSARILFVAPSPPCTE